MAELIIDEKKAKRIYATANGELKQMLIDEFGEEFFLQKITDRVKSFNDVLEISGIKLQDLLQGCIDENEAAHRKIQLIAEVYNEGTVLDPMDTNQYKYYPWFEITPLSGFGLSYHDFGDWDSRPIVGVRLCFKSGELAADAGKKFTEIYAALLIK